MKESMKRTHRVCIVVFGKGLWQGQTCIHSVTQAPLASRGGDVDECRMGGDMAGSGNITC